MSRFSTQQAFDASECDEPVMITAAAANEIIQDHGADSVEFWDEISPGIFAREVDAARVLAWLGY